jgi:hypothetical protein
MAENRETESAAQLQAVVGEIRAWLCSGRLQSQGGAYCAWRDAEADALAYEYPEITGYALTWLAGRVDWTEQERSAGLAAGGWLAARLAAGDLSARTGWENGAVYTFDLGMLAAGLISFGRQAEVEELTQAGLDTASRLARYLEQEGELPALAPDGPRTNRPSQWSTEGRAHLVKCVQSLLLAEELEAARGLLNQALDDQAEDGHFLTQPGDEYVMLHPHIYAIEGLWMWGDARQDEIALERARRATSWAWDHQLPSGGLPRWVSATETGPEQLDVTSQAVRAALMLGLRPRGLKQAIDRLLNVARSDGPHGQALIYQPDGGAAHLNAWVTMFGGQALQLAVEEPAVMSWDTLV